MQLYNDIDTRVQRCRFLFYTYLDVWCILQASHPFTQVHSANLSFLLKHHRWLALAWEVQKVASQHPPLEHAVPFFISMTRSHGAFTGHLRARGQYPLLLPQPHSAQAQASAGNWLNNQTQQLKGTEWHQDWESKHMAVHMSPQTSFLRGYG